VLQHLSAEELLTTCESTLIAFNQKGYLRDAVEVMRGVVRTRDASIAEVERSFSIV